MLERDARPGDAVLTSPAWAERIRAVAPRGVRVLAQPRFTPAELEGVRRVWLVSLPRAPGFSWGPEVDLLSRSSSPEPPLPLGRLELARFEITHPDLPLASLTDRLSTATAEVGGRPCAAEEAGFRCAGGRAEVSVERGVLEVNGLPRPCLLARAVGDTAPVSLTFPAVPIGRVLRGSAGLVPAAEGASTPITVVVRVDDQEAAAVQLDAAGWPEFGVDTARWAGERHAVRLDLVAPEEQALCLQAVTLP